MIMMKGTATVRAIGNLYHFSFLMNLAMNSMIRMGIEAKARKGKQLRLQGRGGEERDEGRGGVRRAEWEREREGERGT
jgi:hypothetical protein